MGPPIFLFSMEESTTHRVTLNNSDISYDTSLTAWYKISFVDGYRLTQFGITTVAINNNGFILCQVPPSDHYSHYLHSRYVAF